MAAIINFLRGVINTIITFFETVRSFFLYIWEFIENIPKYIIDFLCIAWEWFLDLGPWFFSFIYSFFIDLFPADVQSSIDTTMNSTISPYYNVINAWVPLDLASSLIVTYFIFVTVYIVVAWVIKLIPMEG